MHTCVNKILGAGLVLGICLAASAEPLVSNVRASQRTDGSGMVDIYYNLSGGSSNMIVDLTISNDNGATWSVIPLPHLLSGALGSGVTNGTNKHIVWDAARDRAEVYWPQAKARVRASDTGQTVTLQLPGGIFIEMVRIPRGVFTMGTTYPTPPYGQTNEHPAHPVSIDYDFDMGKFEVTQAQWYAVMNSWPYGQPSVNPNLPVVGASWNDAQAFVTHNTLGLARSGFPPRRSGNTPPGPARPHGGILGTTPSR